MDFQFKDVISTLSHIRGGIPLQRLSTRTRYGVHRSIFFGPSYKLVGFREFDEQRDLQKMIVESTYNPDDDTVLARKTVEDREVKIKFIVDLSSSNDAGPYFLKRKMMLEAIGYVGVTGARFQDPIGLAGFTDKIVLDMSPRCGINNFYYLLKTLYDLIDEGNAGKKIKIHKTNFVTVFDFIRKTLNRPHFIPVISDFVGFDKVADSKLLREVVSRHELMFIFLDNPTEITDASGLGYLKRTSIETGETNIISRSKKNLEEISREIRERRTVLRSQLKRMGIYSAVIEPRKNFTRLNKFFIKRRKRI